MTLLSTIQLAKNSLFTSQLGIQVASQNIANADTPGYVREKLLLATAPSQQIGQLTLGSGVMSIGVVREVDQFLQQRPEVALRPFQILVQAPAFLAIAPLHLKQHALIEIGQQRLQRQRQFWQRQTVSFPYRPCTHHGGQEGVRHEWR